MGRKLKLLGIILALLPIFYLALTILKPGLPSGHDISAHAVYSRLFIDALREGQFPVRWSGWIKNGFDFPLFNFYPAGFYYLVALINSVVPSLVESLKITVLLLWWLGALFMFLYARQFGNLAGALSALIYAFTPYLILDIFVRVSYPEVAAITFSVGALWALDRLVITAQPTFGLPLALFLALIPVSHLPTLVILLPILIGYILFLIITREAKWVGLKLTMVAFMLAVGISAFYLLPALFELKLIKSSLLTAEYYDFHPHFVYPQQLFSTFWGYGISQAGPDDGMSFQFGILQWIIIAAALAVLAISKFFKKDNLSASYLAFWLLTILYSLFFMHETSLSFWENIKAISFIQYPWRFLMIVIFACPILVAIMSRSLRKSWQQVLVTFILVFAVFALYRTYLAPATFLPYDYFNIDFPTWRESRGVVFNSYLEEGYLPVNILELPQQAIGRWEAFSEKAKIEEKTVQNHYLKLITQSSEPFRLKINSHYFPGWKAYVDSQEIRVNSENSSGFMNVLVPDGIHIVEVKFTDAPIRSVSNKITIFSIIILLVWQVLGVLHRVGGYSFLLWMPSSHKTASFL